MNILLIDNGTSFLGCIQEQLSDHAVATTTFGDLNYTELNECDAVILSGGHKFAVQDNEQVYSKELRLIVDCPKPMFGICLGFELIAHAFGATLHLLPEKKRGEIEIKPLPDEPLFHGTPVRRVFESHRWAVTQLPKELKAIATSPDGIEAFRHVERPIYAVQFHPEVETPTTDDRDILQNFLRIVAEHNV